MEKKFSFIINSFDNNKNEQQTFTNSCGKWTVFIKSTLYDFAGYIAFEPSWTIFDGLLKDIKITLDFNSTSYSSYSIKDVGAIYIPNKSCFFFMAHNQYSQHNGYGGPFQVSIQVDASSLPLQSKAKSNQQEPLIVLSDDHLKYMFATGKLSDITIKTTGAKEIKAHNFILSRSKVFDTMLNVHDTKEAQERVVKIDDIEHEVLVEMIRYLYADEIPKIKEMALKLLMAANKYDIPGLMNECVEHLTKNVEIATFSEVLVAADQLDIEILKQAVIKFIIDNRKVVFSSESWKQLKKNNMPLAMEVMENFVSGT